MSPPCRRTWGLGLKEYHAPPPDTLSPSVVPLFAPTSLAGHDAKLEARVIDTAPPDSAVLFIRPKGGSLYRGYPMRADGPYQSAATSIHRRICGKAHSRW